MTVLVFSVYPSILSTCLFLSLPIAISIHLSVYPSPYPSDCLPTYKSIHNTHFYVLHSCRIFYPKIVYSSQDERLDGKPAFGIVSWSLQYKRQAGELISDPNLTTRARLLSFNRTQSMVVTGLFTGHNTLRRRI